MLRGNSLAKIDSKGRLKLPAGFRSIIEPDFGREFFVTSIRGESTRIYPIQVYAKLEQQLLEASSLDPRVVKLRNALNYFGQTAVMDAQGRVLIHPLLRERAGLQGDVAVLGQQNYLEVWNRAAFEERLSLDPLTDEDLSGLGQLGF